MSQILCILVSFDFSILILFRKNASVDTFLEDLRLLRSCCLPADVDYRDTVALDWYDIRLSFIKSPREMQSRYIIKDWRTFFEYKSPDAINPVLAGVRLCEDCHRRVYGVTKRRYSTWWRLWRNDRRILAAPYNYKNRRRKAPMETCIIRYLEDLWEVCVIIILAKMCVIIILAKIVYSSFSLFYNLEVMGNYLCGRL